MGKTDPKHNKIETKTTLFSLSNKGLTF